MEIPGQRKGDVRSVCVSSSKWDLIPDSYDFFLPRRGPGLAGVGEPPGRAVNIPWGDNGPFEGNMEQLGVSPQDQRVVAIKGD